MARPIKVGLDYFPLDVGFLNDRKIRFIKSLYGADAVSALVAIYSAIYEDEGYFIELDDLAILDLAEKSCVEVQTLVEIIKCATDIGLFSKRVANEYNVLTSGGIQKRYLEAKKRSVNVDINQGYCVVNDTETPIIATLTKDQKDATNGVNVYRNPHYCIQKPPLNDEMRGRGTQSKVKESKEKQSNINSRAGHDIASVIDYLNQVLNSNYKSTTKNTKSLINARYNEGFTLQDFKTVIDHQYKLWHQDKKMSVYLRPQTLFGTKFESYLQDANLHGEDSKHSKLELKPFEGWRVIE